MRLEIVRRKPGRGFRYLGNEGNLNTSREKEKAMFRRMILSAILGTGMTAGLTMTPAVADAHPPVEFHHRFEVMVRCGHAWENRGTYHDRYEAERVAHHLRYEGFVVEIREF